MLVEEVEGGLISEDRGKVFVAVCATVHPTPQQKLWVSLRLSDSLFQVLPFFLLVPCSLARLLLAALLPLQHRRNTVLPREQAGGQLTVHTKKKKSGCSPKPSYCIQKATWEHLLGCLIHTGQAVVAQWTLYMMRGHGRRERHGCVQRWPQSCINGKQKQAQIIKVSY